MNEFKAQAKAYVKIGERILLLIVGSYLIYLSVNDTRLEALERAIQAAGAASILLGLIPMVWAYIKTVLPTAKKK
ncbi:MAG TPA: hypothetical protein VLG09_02405 [Candidatus Saccharimonadales bacterium]|nr:hypothetical protein [Candidatus Saccharimonadales bacterium]